jgi:hypothetical protein
MTKKYLGLTAKTLDKLNINLRFETAMLWEASPNGYSGDPICDSAEEYWRHRLEGAALSVTAGMLRRFAPHSDDLGPGVVCWVYRQVKAVDPDCRVPPSVGWDSDDFAPSGMPVQWKEAERWLKAALLWQFARETAEKLSKSGGVRWRSG